MVKLTAEEFIAKIKDKIEESEEHCECNPLNEFIALSKKHDKLLTKILNDIYVWEKQND